MWVSMLQRCYNPNGTGYKNYGARGVKVCERWRKSYRAFLKDVGRRPSPRHSIDRFPNYDGDYRPGNVRWATAAEQARTVSAWLDLFAAQGEVGVGRPCEKMIDGHTISQWSEMTGVKESTIRERLRRGWADRSHNGNARLTEAQARSRRFTLTCGCPGYGRPCSKKCRCPCHGQRSGSASRTVTAPGLNPGERDERLGGSTPLTSATVIESQRSESPVSSAADASVWQA